MRYCFKCAPLPKPVFETLKQIAEAEGATQREVVIAGVLALCTLPDTTREAVWRDARAYRRKDAEPA